MGKLVTGDPRDLAAYVATDDFNAIGVSQALQMFGRFNIALWGVFSGAVQLEKTFDGGATWLVATDANGVPVVYEAPMAAQVLECEPGVLYRWNCTQFASGAINYRISGGWQCGSHRMWYVDGPIAHDPMPQAASDAPQTRFEQFAAQGCSGVGDAFGDPLETF